MVIPKTSSESRQNDGSLTLRRLAAKVALAVILVLTVTVDKLGRLFHRRSRKGDRPVRVVMIGTFYNVGWLVAHATPLCKCKLVDEVIVVCDEPLSLQLPKLVYRCPSKQSRARWGRNLAKLQTLVRVALELRPQIYMGYHIMPNSPLALIMARVFGGKAIYQMTGGPIQILEGGYRSENPLLAATGTPSRLLERLMFATVRCFDSVVVRGQSAREFILANRLNRRCIIITGAIDTGAFCESEQPRTYDAVYVSRLVPNKGVEECISVVLEMKRLGRPFSVAIVGGGPLQDALEAKVAEYGIMDQVTFLGQLSNVIPVLHSARLFMLLSPSEGMSIAMLEAMSTGLPVVVNDVGDLSDVFADRQVGILLREFDAQAVARQLVDLLADVNLLAACSKNARQTIVESFSVDSIAERWGKALTEILED